MGQRSAVESVGTWATRKPPPSSGVGGGLAAAKNGKIYATGGDTALLEYDPAADSWATRASRPTARSTPLAAAIDGKIYAVGGGRGAVLNIVEEYDPLTDSWATKTPMPTARGGLGLAAASNGKLYAVGGSVGEEFVTPITFLTNVEEYDPATDTWSTKAPLPTARAGLGLVAGRNGRLYAIGGTVDELVFTAAVEEYDPATNSWTTKAPMPTRRAWIGLAAAANGKLYAVGGLTVGGEVGAVLDTVEEYDPATDSWTNKAPLSRSRVGAGLAAASNGKLYAIGDDTGGSPANEEFTP